MNLALYCMFVISVQIVHTRRINRQYNEFPDEEYCDITCDTSNKEEVKKADTKHILCEFPVSIIEF